MTEYVEVTKVMEFTPDEELIEVGKRYEVVENCADGVFIYANKAHKKYFLYNNQVKYLYESNKEEKKMKYTEEDIKEGTKLRCTNDKDFSHWTTGKVYCVYYGTHNNYVEDDKGTPIPITAMVGRLNKEIEHNAEFEIIKEEKKMKYTEEDIKDGTKLRCIDNLGINRWTKGKIYTVVDKCIIDDDGYTFNSECILNTLNDERNAKFEIFEYPTATITVDIEQQLIEQQLNDRIELLQKERMNIIDKMERMEAQRYKLRDKINKLSEAKKALEILKEFK